MTTRLKATLCAGLLITSLVVSADKPTLILAAEVYAPWSFIENGKSIGIDVDILRLTAKEIGYPVIFKHLPPRRLTLAVASGDANIQLISFIDRTELEHLPDNLEVSSVILYQVKVVGLALKNKKLSINSLAELYQHHMGHVNVREEFEDAILPNLTNRFRVTSEAQLIKVLLRDRIDIGIGDMASSYHYANTLDVSHRIETVYTSTPVSVALVWSRSAFGVNTVEVIDALSKALITVKKRGDIAKIINQYSKTEYFNNFN